MRLVDRGLSRARVWGVYPDAGLRAPTVVPCERVIEPEASPASAVSVACWSGSCLVAVPKETHRPVCSEEKYSSFKGSRAREDTVQDCVVGVTFDSALLLITPGFCHV